MREFKYGEKETYTLQEVKDLLNQNKQFHTKDMIDLTEYQKLEDELKPFKKTAKDAKILDLVKELTDSDKIKDAIALSNLKDEMDDKDIIKSVKATIESREYLKPTINVPEAKKIITTKPIDEDTKESKPFKYIRSYDAK